MIYSVGLLFGQDTDKRESRHAKRVLETLSEQTGGAAYFPTLAQGSGFDRGPGGSGYPDAVHDCVSLDEIAVAGRLSADSR